MNTKQVIVKFIRILLKMFVVSFLEVFIEIGMVFDNRTWGIICLFVYLGMILLNMEILGDIVHLFNGLDLLSEKVAKKGVMYNFIGVLIKLPIVSFIEGFCEVAAGNENVSFRIVCLILLLVRFALSLYILGDIVHIWNKFNIDKPFRKIENQSVEL